MNLRISTFYLTKMFLIITFSARIIVLLRVSWKWHSNSQVLQTI